jgi:hypothetical protein
MAKYRKKPIIIDAIQWTGANAPEVFAAFPDVATISALISRHAKHALVYDGVVLSIVTLEGTMVASVGDWIIKGVSGELYPCKPDIFDLTYEAIEEAKDLK